MFDCANGKLKHLGIASHVDDPMMFPFHESFVQLNGISCLEEVKFLLIQTFSVFFCINKLLRFAIYGWVLMCILLIQLDHKFVKEEKDEDMTKADGHYWFVLFVLPLGLGNLFFFIVLSWPFDLQLFCFNSYFLGYLSTPHTVLDN